jgi:Holliday junction resolvasome RuvABC endonuclease subunit
MIIAGVDQSMTSAGIAGLRNARPVLLTTVGHRSRDAKDWHHRITRITTQSHAIIGRIRTKLGFPDLVLIEAPLTFGIENSTDGYDRYCVFVAVCSWAASQRIPYLVVHNQTRSKWATGRGGSSKEDVVAAVRATWKPWRHHIRNDDIADALTLAEMGARHCGEPLHFPPRRRHIEALAGLDWPSFSCAKPEPSQVGAS